MKPFSASLFVDFCLGLPICSLQFINAACGRYFDCVDICKIYGDDWLEVRRDGVFPNTAEPVLRAFSLTVFDRTELEFSSFQQMPRCLI